jgi:hypothetical protein
MTNMASTKHWLLSMANEDVYGLYEAVGAIKGSFPNQSDAENRRLAEQLIREMLAENLIFVCREWKFEANPNPGSASKVEPIPLDQLDTVLSDRASWEPYDGEGIGFAATDKGYEAWVSPNPN